jgi:hypothetical protein
MRRIGLLFIAGVLVATACSSDDGNQSAFCDRARAFQSQFGSADLADNIAALDTVNTDFVSDAPKEIRDDIQFLVDYVEVLRPKLEAVDASDPIAAFTAAQSAATEVGEAELRAASEHVADFTETECGVRFDLGGGSGEATTTSSLAPGETTTTTETTDTTEDSSGGETSTTLALTDPAPVPEGEDATLGDQAPILAQQCHDGDMQACDDLYQGSDDGGVFETYGNTCGGRVSEDNSEWCVDLFGPGVPS